MDSVPFTTIVLAAGGSIRFRTVGVHKPKGLIQLRWRGVEATMLEHSAQILGKDYLNVRIAVHSKDMEQFANWVNTDAYRCKYGFYYVVATNGQADTAQQAVEAIEGPIVIVNCDNGFETTLSDFGMMCIGNDVACGALVFGSNGETRYGYVDNAPWFTYGTEKSPVSRWALAGAFYFRSRHVLREAYATAPFSAGKECYLSQLFASIPGNKMAVRIQRDQLHEWGTPSDLLTDKTVSVIDADWYQEVFK